MPHNPKPIQDRAKGEGWLVDLTPKDKRSSKVKMYRGHLIESQTKHSDWVISGHLDLGRFTLLDEAKKAIDKLIDKKGRNG